MFLESECIVACIQQKTLDAFHQDRIPGGHVLEISTLQCELCCSVNMELLQRWAFPTHFSVQDPLHNPPFACHFLHWIEWSTHARRSSVYASLWELLGHRRIAGSMNVWILTSCSMPAMILDMLNNGDDNVHFPNSLKWQGLIFLKKERPYFEILNRNKCFRFANFYSPPPSLANAVLTGSTNPVLAISTQC